MKNNFKNWDKERLREVSAKGGRVKSRSKSRAAKIRFRRRVVNHVNGIRRDGMVQRAIEVMVFFGKRNWSF